MTESSANPSLFDDETEAQPQAPEAETPTPAPVDPFDLSALRLGQDFGAALGVKKLITTVPVRKPDKQAFVRVRPGEEWRLQTCLLEFKEPEREVFLVAPALWSELGAEIKPTALFTAITRQGVLFLWPVKLPGADGRSDSWSESAMQAAQAAERAWCRVVPNMSLGGYDLLEAQATAKLPEPEWPDLSLQEIIKIAFRGRMVDSPDHPAIRRLQGAA